MQESVFYRQILPIILTVVICIALTGLLLLEIVLLNRATVTDIMIQVRPLDILVGLTIYLKTAIDFAIYIGRLMSANPSWQSRIAIELGTAIGNAAGTMAILLIWNFFKEVDWLLAIMIFVASLVLFRLAEDSLEHAKDQERGENTWFAKMVRVTELVLDRVNKMIAPALKYIVPSLKMKDGANLKFWPLFALAFVVPFILGLDDFAGYVPLFNIINVFGFAIGVFVGHMILNIFLYISPKHTIKFVKNPVISFIGALVFIGLALWGLIEVVHLIGV